MHRKAICLDFDGVIHHDRKPWVSAEVIDDDPVPGAFDFIRSALATGFDVYVCSCRFLRSLTGENERKGLEATAAWFSAHGAGDLIARMSEPKKDGEACLAFVIEKPIAVLYIDDRGFHFTGEWPSLDFLSSYSPWHRICQ